MKVAIALLNLTFILWCQVAFGNPTRLDTLGWATLKFGMSETQVIGRKVCDLASDDQFERFGEFTSQKTCRDFVVDGQRYQLGLFLFSNGKLTAITLLPEDHSGNSKSKITRDFDRSFGKPTSTFYTGDEGDKELNIEYLKGKASLTVFSDGRLAINLDSTRGDQTTWKNKALGCESYESAIANIYGRCIGIVGLDAFTATGKKPSVSAINQYCGCFAKNIDSDHVCLVSAMNGDKIYQLFSGSSAVKACGTMPK